MNIGPPEVCVGVRILWGGELSPCWPGLAHVVSPVKADALQHLSALRYSVPWPPTLAVHGRSGSGVVRYASVGPGCVRGFCRRATTKREKEPCVVRRAAVRLWVSVGAGLDFACSLAVAVEDMRWCE
eukprot:3182434-Prymnesium_polylepis.2